MDDVLKEIGLATLSQRFKAERVDIYMVSSLSDGELAKLGVDTIGDRHRLRRLCTQRKVNQTTEDNNTGEGEQTNGSDSVREILSERSRLFGYGRGNKQRGRGKRKQTSTHGVTHSFLCLSDKHQTTIPTSAEKEILNNVGLGRKKIKLNRDDDEQSVIQKIMSSEIDTETNETIGFPELRDAGGFELHRSSQNCRELKIIDCKWNSNELQKNVNTQSTIYIRPIQKNLPMTNKKEETNNLVKASCLHRKVEFSIMQLREHVGICSGETNYSLNEPGFVDSAITNVVDATPFEDLNFIEIQHFQAPVISTEPTTSDQAPVISTEPTTSDQAPVISTEPTHQTKHWLSQQNQPHQTKHQ